MRMGFADPPYFKSARKHYARHHKRAHVWDTLDRHARLIDRLTGEFADGWALCCSSVNLRDLLPLCPPAVRVGAWVKPFSIFRPGVNPAYAWEPVIFAGGRPRPRSAATVRDWVSCNITLRTGLAGSKPPAFCVWVFELLGLQPGDVLVDLFPGTGIVKRTFKEFCNENHRLLAPGTRRPRAR